MRSRDIGGSGRRSGIPRPSNAEKSSPPEDSFTPRRGDCLTVAECALPGAGIWPALFAVDVRSKCHEVAIHERAVLRPLPNLSLRVMLTGRLYDGKTLNEIGNHPRARLPFWFEKSNGS